LKKCLISCPAARGRRSCARVSYERSDGRDMLGARPGSFTNTNVDRTIESGDVRREMPARTPCRKRPRAVTQPRRAEAETEAVQDALREIRQLREERQQERESFEMRLRQREEELRQLEARVLQRIPQS